MAKYAVMTRTLEHYDPSAYSEDGLKGQYYPIDELKTMIAEGKSPSYDRSQLGFVVDSLEDAKALKRAKEIEGTEWNSGTQLVIRTVVKIEEVE